MKNQNLNIPTKSDNNQMSVLLKYHIFIKYYHFRGLCSASRLFHSHCLYILTPTERWRHIFFIICCHCHSLKFAKPVDISLSIHANFCWKMCFSMHFTKTFFPLFFRWVFLLHIKVARRLKYEGKYEEMDEMNEIYDEMNEYAIRVWWMRLRNRIATVSMAIEWKQ